MNYRMTMDDAFDVAAKKAAIDGWQGYIWESLPGGDSLVTGCKPDGIISRGPRKGEPRFNRPVAGTRMKIAVSLVELKTAAAEYESETGQCWDCKGSGQVAKSWSAATGTEYTACKRCDGSGLASPPLSATNDGH